MTHQNITDTIESKFGWLSPDEKQKLHLLIRRTWNEAIEAAGEMCNKEKIALEAHKRPDERELVNKGAIALIGEKYAINNLKVKS